MHENGFSKINLKSETGLSKINLKSGLNLKVSHACFLGFGGLCFPEKRSRRGSPHPFYRPNAVSRVLADTFYSTGLPTPKGAPCCVYFVVRSSFEIGIYAEKSPGKGKKY